VLPETPTALLEHARAVFGPGVHLEPLPVVVASDPRSQRPLAAPGGQGRIGRAARSAAPSLDTLPLKYRGPCYTVAVRHFGAAGSQITGVYLDEERVCRGGRARRARDPSRPRRPEHIHRARTQLKRRLRAAGVDHLMTLTKRGKFASLDDSWAALHRFSRLMDRQYGVKWRYVAVPELHADGEGWHVHLGVRGFFWAGLVRRMWYRALGGRGDETGADTPGNIDLQRIEGARAWARVGRYLGKYLSKGFVSLPGNKRAYACTRGLDVDVQRLRYAGTIDGSHGLARALRADFFSGAGSIRHWSYGGVDGFTIDTG
jgi:hypothetical protein